MAKYFGVGDDVPFEVYIAPLDNQKTTGEWVSFPTTPENLRDLFAVADYRYQSAVMASAMTSVAQVGELCRRQAGEGTLPAMLPDELQAQYPQFASSLLNLLRTAEKTLEN